MRTVCPSFPTLNYLMSWQVEQFLSTTWTCHTHSTSSPILSKVRRRMSCVPLPFNRDVGQLHSKVCFSSLENLRMWGREDSRTWGCGDSRTQGCRDTGTVTTETIDLGRKTLSRVREVGSVLYLNKQNASCEVLSEIEQIRDCELRTS